MKSCICPACHAPVDPNTSEKFLRCDYCGTKFLNDFFDTDAEAGSPMELDKLCIRLLKELGAEMAQNINNTLFGTPITSGSLYEEACESFQIPEENEVFFICASGRKGKCDKGFAMTGSGIYFSDEEGDCGSYSWSQFVDEDVSYENNTLTIIDSSFRTRAETEAIGDFLITFSEQSYSQWYGEKLNSSSSAEDLDSLCIQRLIEKCEDEDIHFTAISYGDPMENTKQLKNARVSMAIPDEDDIYLFFDNTIFNNGKAGFAMTDSGVYYNMGLLGSKGHLTWEEFVNSPVYFRLPDKDSSSDLGQLTFCEAFSIDLNYDISRDRVMFFIELHNDLYKEHTGERAPGNWGIRSHHDSLLDIILS